MRRTRRFWRWVRTYSAADHRFRPGVERLEEVTAANNLAVFWGGLPAPGAEARAPPSRPFPG